MPTSQHREPPSPKSAHLSANTAQTAAKTLPSAPIQPHDPPNALLELAEMRGNEREIDLSVLPPGNYTVGTRESMPRIETRQMACYCAAIIGLHGPPSAIQASWP